MWQVKWETFWDDVQVLMNVRSRAVIGSRDRAGWLNVSSCCLEQQKKRSDEGWDPQWKEVVRDVAVRGWLFPPVATAR